MGNPFFKKGIVFLVKLSNKNEREKGPLGICGIEKSLWNKSMSLGSTIFWRNNSSLNDKHYIDK